MYVYVFVYDQRAKCKESPKNESIGWLMRYLLVMCIDTIIWIPKICVFTVALLKTGVFECGVVIACLMQDMRKMAR